MAEKFEIISKQLVERPRVWLITGAAGFIGSNLLEALLKLRQRVVAADNFATGHQHNLDDVRRSVGEKAWGNCSFIAGDIRDAAFCQKICSGVEIVLHQAALGSVPRSIENPAETNSVNVDGFLNMLLAARDNRVRRFVFASSSSVYGDCADSPKVESRTGNLLSPYAASKMVNELYSGVFGRAFGLESIGLRYFNVFGPRQDPQGAYAAVIPLWLTLVVEGKSVTVNGNPAITRDFCYVDNVVQANILSGCVDNQAAIGQCYNVAYGQQTTLEELHTLIAGCVADHVPTTGKSAPIIGAARAGDVQHSLGDISKASQLLGYQPQVDINAGMQKLVKWYLERQC